MPFLTEIARRHPAHAIRTTIDMKIQRRSAARAAQALHELAPSRISAAAVVVLDTPTADCLASVSLSLVSRWELLNLASSPRSSGSTLKPFIYAAAFGEGICAPQSILNDWPTAWHGYEPRDYDRKFSGPISAADALSQSRNVPAMRVLAKVGVDRVVLLLETAGLNTLSRDHIQYGLPLAIGGADVTPMELAEAYATLARGGVHRRATILDSMESMAASDAVVPNASPRFTLALTPASCRAALNCLADQERTEQECPAAAALFPAWKTGTSSGHRDAWCAAVTPRRTVVVWLGNANGVGSDALVGQNVAAPLALEILSDVDPGGAGFAPPRSFRVYAKRGSTNFVADSESFSMITPTDDEEIVRDPSLPIDRQQVSLRASGASTEHLWWFVDNDFVGKSDGDQPLWWSPTPGEHAVRVLADSGLSAVSHINVR
jgi:penicillin-binding protein 1C